MVIFPSPINYLESWPNNKCWLFPYILIEIEVTNNSYNRILMERKKNTKLWILHFKTS